MGSVLLVQKKKACQWLYNYAWLFTWHIPSPTCISIHPHGTDFLCSSNGK